MLSFNLRVPADSFPPRDWLAAAPELLLVEHRAGLLGCGSVWQRWVLTVHGLLVSGRVCMV